MKKIKLIVGLANPIVKYDKTRHNVGSWFIQNLANYHHKVLKENKKLLGYTASFIYSNSRVYLFIPNVFMNINGESILTISKFYNIKLNEMLIVHDELDLNPGLIRLKLGYGHNGHNGVRNIVNLLSKKKHFLRIQIGIGRPMKSKKIADFVLSSPLFNERKLIEESILNAVNITNFLVKDSNILIIKKILKCNRNY